LLPREASEAFSKDLLPYLLQLKDWISDPVWAGAKKLMQEKVATLRVVSDDDTKIEQPRLKS